MKRFFAALAVILLLLLSACGRIRGTDELIEFARTELPIAEADTIELSYAGMVANNDLALFWFISGNEYQSHYYLPIECRIVGEDEYVFSHTYKPMDRCMDTAVLYWREHYVFLINNPAVTALRVTNGEISRDIPIEKAAYPYIIDLSAIPDEYVFLDSDGRELN